MRILVFIFLLLFLFSCATKKETINNPTFISYNVQSSFPHDKTAFTEGLLIHNGQLYESTGEDNSWIGIVNVKNGIADKKVTLDKEYFGEGITILNNKVYQLTWKNHKGFVYDLKSFEKLREFEYSTEGWGMTHNGTHLIMSDGTSRLYLLDTVNLKTVKTINVTYKDQPVNSLNELEYVDGFIYANIWRTYWIAKIDPATGVVSGFLDCTKLAQQVSLLNSSVDVLNGIAWHEDTRSLLVTGKYWPFIYVLKMSEVN